MNTSIPLVAVVDGDPHRYPFLITLQQQARARLVSLHDGRSALRASNSTLSEVAFWLVNDELADMRGIECIEMLAEVHADSRFFLIADEYKAQDERSCFRFSRVKYLCRPLDTQWLSRLLQSVIGARHGAFRSRPHINTSDAPHQWQRAKKSNPRGSPG